MTDTEMKTPKEWAEEQGITIMDPDGWRRSARRGEKDFDMPLTKAEFQERMFVSTCLFGGQQQS